MNDLLKNEPKFVDIVFVELNHLEKEYKLFLD
jgi:hypothetical protein